MFKKMRKDLDFIRKNDPAARNKFEIFLTYSGFHAVQWYRVAHFFYKIKLKLLARIVSQSTRFFTGIEIHPAASLGTGIFIDHGMGVVIGETAILGNNIIIYQGVTLGGTGKEKGKRHPTIEDDCMISSGAKVLGGFTVGKGSKIGANSVVLKEVPPYSTVVGIPGKVVKRDLSKLGAPLDQALPDPILDEIAKINERLTHCTLCEKCSGAIESEGSKNEVDCEIDSEIETDQNSASIETESLK